jgi:hypothetical protein
VNVHVTAVASVPPVPSMFLGLAPTIFYGIMTVIVAVVVTAVVLVLRSRRSSGQPVEREATFSKCTSSDRSYEHASEKRPVQTSSACTGLRA